MIFLEGIVKLSEVNFENLRINDRVISARGIPGYISELHPASPLYRYDTISMVWYNGKISLSHFHMNLDKIQYLGRS